MLYINICGVFWAKTSQTHSGDNKDLFYILWKGHYTTSLIVNANKKNISKDYYDYSESMTQCDETFATTS